MSTWLDRWDRRYTDRVRLLVEILPVLASEPCFALKGGTAINLFEHDLPRLSVDIDLAWLPVNNYAEDAKRIAEALGRLADALRARPLNPDFPLDPYAEENMGVKRTGKEKVFERSQRPSIHSLWRMAMASFRMSLRPSVVV